MIIKQEIKGKNLYLKCLAQKNANKTYCRWINDPEVNQYLVIKKTTVPKLKKYIKEKNQDPNCLLLGMFYKENRKPRTRAGTVRGKHIGNIKLEPIDFRNKRATLGILIGEKSYWGQGLGSEAVRLLVNYVFKKLKLKEVYLGVEPGNKRGIKFYKRLGFKYVGTKKIKIRQGKKMIDVIEYGMSIKKL